MDALVSALYVPILDNRAKQASFERKAGFWDALLGSAESLLDRPSLIIGDLNTGRPRCDEKGKIFVWADRFERLEKIGWIDAWRHCNPGPTEFSGHSNAGNGFRIDHAFVSPALLPRVRAYQYSYRERIDGISDHSILLIEID